MASSGSRRQPNFEKPGSADGDNTYEVTVTATDEQSNSSDRDVKVMVTNSGGTRDGNAVQAQAACWSLGDGQS